MTERRLEVKMKAKRRKWFTCLDSYGWPIEQIRGRPVRNLVRRLLWTRKIIWGKMKGQPDAVERLREKLTGLMSSDDTELFLSIGREDAREILAALATEGDGDAHAHCREEDHRLKLQLRTMVDERHGDVWLWQGDGEDDLESLGCPVLIRPEVLAVLIAIRTEGEPVAWLWDDRATGGIDPVWRASVLRPAYAWEPRPLYLAPQEPAKEPVQAKAFMSHRTDCPAMFLQGDCDCGAGAPTEEPAEPPVQKATTFQNEAAEWEICFTPFNCWCPQCSPAEPRERK